MASPFYASLLLRYCAVYLGVKFQDLKNTKDKKSMKLFILLFSTFIISGCKTTQTKPLINADDFSNTIKEVIAKNQGKILTPDQAGKINWSDIKIGYTFSYKSTSSRFASEDLLFKLKSIDNQKYFFDYYENGELSSTRSYYYENGVKFISFHGGKFSKRGPSVNGCHQFTIGLCDYESSGKKITQSISFNDGVWIYKRQGIGLSQIISHVVYDVNGVELFNRTSLASPTGAIISGWDQIVINNN